MAQLAMMFSMPLCFQVNQRASATSSGGHLVPAVAVNALGGLLAGRFIRRTGHYSMLLVLAGLIASVTYILLFLRWDGETGNLGVIVYCAKGYGHGNRIGGSFRSNDRSPTAGRDRNSHIRIYSSVHFCHDRWRDSSE